MPRGGRRENAGKKSTWESGRSFAETKVIRVPIEFADQLLELAHEIDAGGSIDLVTNSNTVDSEEVMVLQETIKKLQEHVAELESQLSDANLEEKRVRVLASLKRGAQSPEYKGAKKALTTFIEVLMGRKVV
jgi:ribosomal protein S15P/S13E